MLITRRRFTAASALALASPPPALAQSSSVGHVPVQVGVVSIRVPPPQGFVETSKRAPDVYALALAYSAGDARIVAHFVKQDDLVQFERGRKTYFKEFLLVQTPRRAENIQVTQAQFDKLRAGTAALQSQLSSKLEPRLAAEAERVSKAVSATAGANIKVGVGEMVPVSVDRNDERVMSYSVLASASVSESGGATNQNMVASTAACFLSGKVVMLNAYRVFRSPRDLQNNREFLASWVSATLAAN
jgi:hypothetical protein